MIDAAMPLEPVTAAVPRRGRRSATGTSMARGELGVIASVTRPFCGDCTRARLSAEGSLYTCLFAVAGTDLKGPLRAGAPTPSSRDLVRSVWSVRADRYSELR